MTWMRLGAKAWKSNSGQWIIDHSLFAGGERVSMFCVYADKQSANDGMNYASRKTLREIKIAADPLELSKQNDATKVISWGRK